MTNPSLQIGNGNWAYKENNLLGYAISPFNDKFSPREITFTRASDGTRVNKDGLIEKGRENLLLQSNTFDTTWILSSASITSGQSGYDGSSDAWLMTEGNIKQTFLFPTRLANYQLEDLTGDSYQSYIEMANALNYYYD